MGFVPLLNEVVDFSGDPGAGLGWVGAKERVGCGDVHDAAPGWLVMLGFVNHCENEEVLADRVQVAAK